MSNPLRQSLYTLDDCLNGGEYKATAAVKSLTRIYPAVVSGIYIFYYAHDIDAFTSFLLIYSLLCYISQEAQSIVMAIPMPGHPVTSQEENSVLEDCKNLHNLIDSHDAVFLLTDTRESRWLPTLLCANTNKVYPLSLSFPQCCIYPENSRI